MFIKTKLLHVVLELTKSMSVRNLAGRFRAFLARSLYKTPSFPAATPKSSASSCRFCRLDLMSDFSYSSAVDDYKTRKQKVAASMHRRDWTSMYHVDLPVGFQKRT
eukprot:scpid50821/ scgid27150/ 